MKTVTKFFLILFAILAASGLVGCGSTGELTKAKVGIVDGKKSIDLESHKDTKIDKFRRLPDGTIELEGYQSVANQAAIEASRAQTQMVTDMLGLFGNLAAKYFSAGVVSQPLPAHVPPPSITVPATVVLTNAPAR